MLIATFATPFKKQPYIVTGYIVESPTLETLESQLPTVAAKAEGTVAGERAGMAAGGEDDIVPMQETVQLRDPVSLTIIELPVRSRQCVHVQCFDFAVHMSINRVRPIWKCPHCNGPARWEDLVVDAYFRGILGECDDNVKHVLVNADGSWSRIHYGGGGELGARGSCKRSSRSDGESGSEGPLAKMAHVEDHADARGTTTAADNVIDLLSDSE